jgi:hypothetical protein
MLKRSPRTITKLFSNLTLRKRLSRRMENIGILAAIELGVTGSDDHFPQVGYNTNSSGDSSFD